MQQPEAAKALICVDDEPILLMAMKQELKLNLKDRVTIDTCSRAGEALKRIEAYRSRNVDVILVISDWLMPGMRGDEFLAEVHRAYPDIPMVLVTGQADEAEIARLKEAVGLRHVLRKPWRSKELLRIVEETISA